MACSILSAWSVSCVIALATCMITLAEPVDLRGRVVDAEGRAIARATVLLSTARPKVGVAILCPSCHLDCGRNATTSTDGTFVIPGVDGTQMFTLLAIGPGWSPMETPFLDPGSDTTISLSPRPPSPEDHSMILRERVLDLNGGPIADAKVSPQMFWWSMPEIGGNLGGNSRLEGAETLAVTAPDGRFTPIVPRALNAMDVRIDAPAMAPIFIGRVPLNG